MKTHLHCLLLGALAIFCLAGAPAVQAGTISFEGPSNPAVASFADVTDFSNTGLNAGKEGYIFFNWARSAPVTGAAVDANVNNQLPSWVAPNFNPADDDYSFDDLVTTSGGFFHWNTLKLPGGEIGPSGSTVDPAAADNSNNSISQLWLTGNVPSTFYMHVVVDTTLGAHDPISRLRARAESSDGLFEDDVRLENLSFNGIADIYTFRYDGWQAGDFIKIQLNSGNAGISPGIAGLMFDVNLVFADGFESGDTTRWSVSAP